MSYYFLANVLPPLDPGQLPPLTFTEMRHLLELNLSPEDTKKARVVRSYIDIKNLRLFWRGEEIDHRGNLAQDEIEEALLVQEGFPCYVWRFLDKYDSTEDRLRHFSSLFSSYFQEEMAQADGFLRQYLAFEREWRLVMLGFRTKRLGRDLATELQFEDPSDTIVVQLMAQRDAKHFEPPYGYEELKPLFEEHQSDPNALSRAMLNYRCGRVDDLLEREQFSIDFILGYLVKLILIEQLLELDDQRGSELVQGIVKEVS